MLFKSNVELSNVSNEYLIDNLTATFYKAGYETAQYPADDTCCVYTGYLPCHY